MNYKVYISCLLAIPSILLGETISLNESKSILNERSNDVSIEQPLISNLKVTFNLQNLEKSTSTEKTLSDAGMSELSVIGLQKTAQRGAPQLPVKSFLFEAMPSDLQIVSTLNRGINLPDLIPAPTVLKLRCTDCVQPAVTVDQSAYRSSENTFKMEYLGDFRGKPITRVDLIPAKFSSAEGTTIYPTAQFEIRMKNDQQELNRYKTPENVITEATLNQKYIIISSASLVEGTAEFVEWKRSKGYDVSVYTLNQIGNSATAIKNFLRSEYNRSKFTYVLLVGNARNMPTEYVATSSSSRTPSDLRYFTMGGSDDSIPDVFSGRISATTVAEVRNQLSKSIKYEQKDFSDDSGLTKHLGIASNEGSNPSDVEYLRQMRAPLLEQFEMTTTSLYQGSGAAMAGEVTMPSTANSIKSVLSSGVRFINYIGHGSGTSWPSLAGSPFSTYHMANLPSGVVTPIVLDVACQNGYFNGENSFGEAFMNATSSSGEASGAVAYYGGSVNISWNPPAVMAVGFGRMIKDLKLTHLGEALLASQLYLAENYSAGSDFIDNLEWYHLQGDPSLQFEGENLVTGALANAISNKDLVTVAQILNSQASEINFNMKVAKTPLIIAIAKLESVELLELLLVKGNGKININAQDANKATALQIAIKKQNMEMFDLLLKAGINVNLRDNTGSIALHHAVKLDSLAMVSALINNSSELSVKNKFKCMPRNYAQDDINTFLKSKKAKRALLFCKKNGII